MYRLPLGAVAYLALLCTMAAVIFAVLDFLRVRKSHRLLSGFHPPESISPEALPLPDGRADKQASGLGLYLCRLICDNLGHKISAESSVGKGTTVKIDISGKETVIE